MKIDLSNCTEEELWHYVATHLKKSNFDTVLVGGAVVSIYTDGAYRSGDLDFVHLDLFKKGIENAMKSIGFRKKGRHFVHPKCKHLFVEFPSGPPLSIGEDTSIQPAEVHVEGEIIKIYSPTDCVKDRLASYIHFKAEECLDQAVLVAKRHPIKLSEVERWCKSEGGSKHWKNFLRRLK